MKNYSNLLFIFCLLMSTMICISANSWLGAWIGLEMNLLSFIPLMNNNKNSLSNEASLKYFMIQALASILLLFFICINFINFNFFIILFNKTSYLLMINSSLLMKLGAAPFHFWFPSIMNQLNWFNNLLLMTWQKINPFICLSYCMNMKFILLISVFSIIIGSLGGLNSSSIRMILSFSSITHIGWMLLALTMSEIMFYFYLNFYIIISISLIFFLKKYKLYYLNQLLINTFSNNSKLTFSMVFLSMGGLPPFLGFIPKWFIINKLISLEEFLIMFIIVMMTLLTLYVYLRMVFNFLIFNNLQMYWKFNMNKKNIFNYFMILSSMFFPLIFNVFMN